MYHGESDVTAVGVCSCSLDCSWWVVRFVRVLAQSFCELIEPQTKSVVVLYKNTVAYSIK